MYIKFKTGSTLLMILIVFFLFSCGSSDSIPNVKPVEEDDTVYTLGFSLPVEPEEWMLINEKRRIRDIIVNQETVTDL